MSTIDTQISPVGSLEVLSKAEAAALLDESQAGLREVFRKCSLAVLNCGSDKDDIKSMMNLHKDFDIRVIQRERGIKLDIKGAPEHAFVDGKLIKGIHEHLFAVLRDILYINNEINRENSVFDLQTSGGITDAVFHILRNAGILKPKQDPNLVVCWGGHSIGSQEYLYTKRVGYELGLRAMDICTGCGPGAMKGPMKGATIAHSKQRGTSGRYLGFTEPGIIAAEAPNPIVNNLVILPDIEKRLEAFVRAGHGIVVFPGGAGTAEEILYILGILMHPENKHVPFPLVFTGPKESQAYFEQIDQFIRQTLGDEAAGLYKIIIDDAQQVAAYMRDEITKVREHRKSSSDAYYFNWGLKIDPIFQEKFIPTHENVANLQIHKNQEPHELAAQLRRAFSAIVAGNVKLDGITAIKEHGPFVIEGDASIMQKMDKLLESFVVQQRMKLPGTKYEPCYRIKS